ncbi:signal recognition particle [Roseibium sp.]|uniref:signal recognition particle n=1 Tax=Roseibium sp. TaxID=1936156 RepID=UPI003A96E6EF
MEATTSLGGVLASEDFCDLDYNQSAIAGYIDKTVPATDMSFPSQLMMMTEGSKYQLKELSASAKTAHCAQIRRIARAYGFIS